MKLNNNDDSHNSGLNLLIYNMLLDIESHPAWVCGLKPKIEKGRFYNIVTPCVGVWIETSIIKSCCPLTTVTPCVGVWIETIVLHIKFWEYKVTPCVGVWIETYEKAIEAAKKAVTPCVGVWIETSEQ